MATSQPTEIHAVDGLSVSILDQGEVVTVDYHGAMTEHTNSLWWGTAVGFRAMQAAAQGMSVDGLWSRDDLYIVSGHPGPGVLDSIDYVTKTVARDRCAVINDPTCQMGCNSNMQFKWWVSDGVKTAVVQLVEDFVPREFYDLADRLWSPDEREDDQRLFEIFKVKVNCNSIWHS